MAIHLRRGKSELVQDAEQIAEFKSLLLVEVVIKPARVEVQQKVEDLRAGGRDECGEGLESPAR